MENKYDFSKIPSGLRAEIFLEAKVLKGVHDRRAYGFMWESTSEIAAKVKRTELLVPNHILQLIAYNEFLDLVIELIERNQNYQFEYYVYFENPDAYKLLIGENKTLGLTHKNIISQAQMNTTFLQKTGLEFEFIVDTSNIRLSKYIDDACTEYAERDDFQGETFLLSSGSSSFLDDQLLNLLTQQQMSHILKEYVGFLERGVVGVDKKVITPLDEGSVNFLFENMLELVPRFPFGKELINSRIRRMTMTIRDSDLCILFTNCNGEENFSFPDNYYYYIAKFFEVPIVIYDVDTKQWYRRSTSEKRDLVKNKNVNIYGYKNVSYYCRPNLVYDIWNNFKKLIQSKR